MTQPTEPEPDYTDQFAPDPTQNRTITCLHCGQSYPENDAKYEIRPKFSIVLPDKAFWWCRNPDCDGAGVGFDLQLPPPEATCAA